MTEAQLRTIPAFQTLPVYDESDERSNAITNARAGGFRAIRECLTLQEVEECLRNPRLVPLGALRATAGGNGRAIAYFGETG
jgi:hypothetical protein